MIGDKLLQGEYYKRSAKTIHDAIKDKLSLQEHFILTIGGESGAGKTETASELIQLLKEDGIKAYSISLSDYYYDPPATNRQRRMRDIHHVGLNEVQLDLLDEHLRMIKRGEAGSIEKPLVNFEENQITSETVDFTPYQVIIVEGTYATALRFVDYRVFMSGDFEDTREMRKKRGRDEQTDFLERVLAREHGIVSAHAALCDLIIPKFFDEKSS
jgi:uridine kinase